MKKYFGKAATFLLFCLLLVPIFSTPVAARRTSIVASLLSGNPLPAILFVVIVVILTVIKYIRKKRNGDGKTDIFPGQIDVSGLSVKEIEMLNSYQQEVKAKKPDPVSTRCPNCGAPLTISDTVECPYCRSLLTNNSIDPKYRRKKPIPPEQYNPRRYYQENNTGYDSIKDQPNDGSYYGEQQTGYSPYGTGTPSTASAARNQSSPFASDAYSSTSAYGNNPSSYGSTPYGSNPSSYGNDPYNANPSSYGSTPYGSDPYGSSGSGNDSFGSGFASGSGFNDHL